jgi:hypothetical protein
MPIDQSEKHNRVAYRNQQLKYGMISQLFSRNEVRVTLPVQTIQNAGQALPKAGRAHKDLEVSQMY